VALDQLALTLRDLVALMPSGSQIYASSGARGIKGHMWNYVALAQPGNEALLVILGAL
jgi:hypothetical protein